MSERKSKGDLRQGTGLSKSIKETKRNQKGDAIYTLLLTQGACGDDAHAHLEDEIEDFFSSFRRQCLCRTKMGGFEKFFLD